jgi:hypothetical protein
MLIKQISHANRTIVFLISIFENKRAASIKNPLHPQ